MNWLISTSPLNGLILQNLVLYDIWNIANAAKLMRMWTCKQTKKYDKPCFRHPTKPYSYHSHSKAFPRYAESSHSLSGKSKFSLFLWHKAEASLCQIMFNIQYTTEALCWSLCFLCLQLCWTCQCSPVPQRFWALVRQPTLHPAASLSDSTNSPDGPPTTPQQPDQSLAPWIKFQVIYRRCIQI